MVFDAIEEHLSGEDKKTDNLQYQVTQANAKLDIVLDWLTGLSDLPED